ncbi:MAG: YihY/virulence factor BrkB family protein [Planctomycetia bacterium]|nr:YihY/virulence factor BrkB family protein [Planctomycetia bacterium]
MTVALVAAGKKSPVRRVKQPLPARHRRTQSASPSWFALVKQTFQDWQDDKAPRLGAALAYYSIFSLAPLLVVCLAVAGMFFDGDRVFDELEAQLSQLLGDKGAAAVEELLRAAQKPAQGTIATITGAIVLLWGASGVFAQLQDALNTIWEVKPKPGRGVWGTIKSRFLSFTMVLGTGFLLLISLVLSTFLQAVGAWTSRTMGGPEWFLQALNLLGSYAVISLLFAMIFKFVPDAVIRWRDVWIGAAATAALFVVGKWAIGLYLGRGGISTAFGSAASLVLVLVWVYYSAQILFLGAEFTQAYASMYGSRVIPAPDAESTTVDDRAQEGLE